MEIIIKESSSFLTDWSFWLSLLTISISIIAIIIAYLTLKQNNKQIGFSNTNKLFDDFISNNSLIREGDKINWNILFNSIDRKMCGKYALSETFSINNNSNKIIDVFTEGEFSYIGESVSQIMNFIEELASQVKEGIGDEKLFFMAFGRFLDISSHYIYLLIESDTENVFNFERDYKNTIAFSKKNHKISFLSEGVFPIKDKKEGTKK